MKFPIIKFKTILIFFINCLRRIKFYHYWYNQITNQQNMQIK